MTEKELVEWIKPLIKEDLSLISKRLDDAKSLDDLEDFRKHYRHYAKLIKDSILAMHGYISVSEEIKIHTDVDH